METILDFFGDIGGFIEIVHLIGFSCTAAFVTRSMNSEMIKQVYQVQRYTKDNTEFDFEDKDQNDSSEDKDIHSKSSKQPSGEK